METTTRQSVRRETPQKGLEQIFYGDLLLATILRATYKTDGIQFFTPGSFSQQLGYMNHPAGHHIIPHDHNPVARSVEWTQETLFVRSGRVRLDLYLPATREYLTSRELGPGDIVLLSHGGHGFEILEPSEMVEVKQGPYAEDADKTRFAPKGGPAAPVFSDADGGSNQHA